MRPLKDILAAMLHDELPIEEYSKDAWWIGRIKSGMYRTAEHNLLRSGFETYSPTFKCLEPMPLRMITAKRRHQAALFKREVRRRRFDGYLFVRRIFGHYDANRLFDIDGCGGLLVDGERKPVLISDYDVELMRLVEADGSLDQVHVERHRGYKVARLPADGSDKWTGSSKIVGRIDEFNKTVVLVARLGRIARLIAGADR
jgi:hypothetical protein